jgi:hypothetical protein
MPYLQAARKQAELVAVQVVMTLGQGIERIGIGVGS